MFFTVEQGLINKRKMKDTICYVYKVCTPPPFFSAEGGGVKTPTKFSKWGGLTGSQFLEWVAGEKGVTLFRGKRGLINKKVYKQKSFSQSVITKNLN